MLFLFVKAPVSVGAHRLQYAHQHKGRIVFLELFHGKGTVLRQQFQIVGEQFLSGFLRNVGLGIVKEGGHVVRECPFSAALIVNKIKAIFMQHDVARLEISEKKEIGSGLQQKTGQSLEIVFKQLLIKGNRRQFQKIVFEIVQVPGDGLPVKCRPWVAPCSIHPFRTFCLEIKQCL